MRIIFCNNTLRTTNVYQQYVLMVTDFRETAEIIKLVTYMEKQRLILRQNKLQFNTAKLYECSEAAFQRCS